MFSVNDSAWLTYVMELTLDVRVPILACCSYLLGIYLLRSYMRSVYGMSPQHMNQYLIIAHNTIIAAASLFMLAASLTLIYRAVREGVGGIFSLYCDQSVVGVDASYFLLWLYYISKFYELFDTIIIILKNGDLIFLHYYHHCIIIPITWAWVVFRMRFGIIGLSVNTAVHAVMYSYYASSIAIRIFPTGSFQYKLVSFIVRIRSYITLFQIVQFALGFLLSIPYLWFYSYHGCCGLVAFAASTLMNASFLYLFSMFYLRDRRRALD
jgi:fatty acid elongase 3